MTSPGSVRILARACLALALPVCLAVALAGLAQPARAAAAITVDKCDESNNCGGCSPC